VLQKSNVEKTRFASFQLENRTVSSKAPAAHGLFRTHQGTQSSRKIAASKKQFASPARLLLPPQ